MGKLHAGQLPALGEWSRLSIDADRIGLRAGMRISRLALTQLGGTVYWDRIGVLRNAHAEFAKLYVLPLLLHHGDSGWTTSRVDSLPQWLRRPANLRTIERFSLRVGLFSAAHAFATHGQTEAQPLVAYLMRVGEDLFARGSHTTALACLRHAELQAEGEERLKAQTALSESYKKLGNPRLASALIAKTLGSKMSDSQYAKHAMLHAKYLYEAGSYSEVISAAGRYLNTPSCRPYEPQILYLTWLSHRKLNDVAASRQLQDQILHKHPNHPLTADVYFSMAVTELSSGNYAAASRYVDIIETRFPSSRLVPRARNIRQKLASATK